MLIRLRRWLYRLVLGMDANFRLKNRLRGGSKTDPGLGTGWAYFVPDKQYREHILNHVTQEEVSNWSSYDAFVNVLITCVSMYR